MAVPEMNASWRLAGASYVQPLGDTDPVSTDFSVPRTDVSKSLQGQHEALTGLSQKLLSPPLPCDLPKLSN